MSFARKMVRLMLVLTLLAPSAYVVTVDRAAALASAYELNGTPHPWEEATLTADGDTLAIVADDSPLSPLRIHVTAPERSTVTIQGNPNITYTNVYIEVDEAITLQLENLLVVAPQGDNFNGLSFIKPNSHKDFTLILVGDNAVTGFDGIHADSNHQLTIKGSGTLKATGLAALAANTDSGHGIHLLSDGTLNSEAGAKLIIESQVKAYGGDSLSSSAGSGIFADWGNMLVKSGSVTAVGGQTSGDRSALTGSGVTRRGGYGINLRGWNFPQPAGVLTIEGGQVTATGGAAMETDPKGDYFEGGRAIIADTSVTISGGTVIATGGASEAQKGGDGLYSPSLEISGSATSVTSTGGASNAADGGVGLFVTSDIAIDAATVTATGGNGKANEYGIFSPSGKLTIGHDSVVKASGGQGTIAGAFGGPAVYVNGTIDIDDAEVIAAGGSGVVNGGHGLFSLNGDIAIRGGANVTSSGGDGPGGVGGAGLRAFGGGSGKTVAIEADAGNVYVRGGQGASATRGSIIAKDVRIASGNVGPIVMEGTGNPRSIKNSSVGDDVYMLDVSVNPAAAVTIQSPVIGALAGSYTYSAPTKADGLAYVWLPADTQTIQAAGYRSETKAVTADDGAAVVLLLAAPDATADDAANTIVGATAAMEYSTDDGEHWTAYNPVDPPAFPGAKTVKIRIAATNGSLAGHAATLTFTANPASGLTVVSSDPSGVGQDGKTALATSAILPNGHKLVYFNFGSGTAIVPEVGETLIGYTDLPVSGIVPAANNDKFGVAEIDQLGKVVKFGQTVAIVVAEPTFPDSGPDPVALPEKGSPEPASSPKPATPNPAAEEAVEVLVNGKVEHAGKATTREVDGIATTHVIVDPAKLQAKLDEEGAHAVVTIPVKSASNVIVGELNGQMIKNMETLEATLVLHTDKASYTLPAQEINIDALSRKFGDRVKLADIQIKVTIAQTPDVMAKVAESAAALGEFTLVARALDFTITGTYGDQTVEADSFNAYVERKIVLPEDIDPDKITTGVVIEPDGKTRHVPTRVVRENGKVYAIINSLTNSTYSVVWHPLVFADVERHWAKDAVNDMGSRLVINGVDRSTFIPDAEITRAEFTAVVVRGLGLRLGEGSFAFGDIPGDAWYESVVQTAVSFGLVAGFEDGAFRPEEKLTREQAIVIVARAMKWTGLAKKTGSFDTEIQLGQFVDGADASSWSKESIALATKSGLVNGRNGDKLEAGSIVTRAEAATLMQRLLKLSDLI
ncbi:DUF4073 domain-containing protein [Paenibacillus cymbidii]|uniref:DUF4073 domain-containing protein n=1 Tax=Paenibacillus cymbidii TaxID=1639034 RepID=UPI0010817D30|nr:DUF4073 domain-containing protein [Paenibacillus cymbidii]